MNFDLLNFAEKCHVFGAAEKVAQFAELQQFVAEANKITNLTRIIEPEDFAVKHVADSLAIVQFFPDLAERELELADIGCGAGFPSVVLAMAFPNLKITAIDSIGKKVAFVASCQAHFQLKNLTVLQGRSVELNRKAEFRQKFDLVTARAVAPSPSLYAGTSKMVRRNGRYIFYKTPNQAESEWDELQKSPLHWQKTPVFELPQAAGERLFVYATNKPVQR